MKNGYLDVHTHIVFCSFHIVRLILILTSGNQIDWMIGVPNDRRTSFGTWVTRLFLFAFVCAWSHVTRFFPDIPYPLMLSLITYERYIRQYKYVYYWFSFHVLLIQFLDFVFGVFFFIYSYLFSTLCAPDQMNRIRIYSDERISMDGVTGYRYMCKCLILYSNYFPRCFLV